MRLTFPLAVDDPYNVHFGPDTKLLTEEARTAIDSRRWTSTKRRQGSLGEISVQAPANASVEHVKGGLFVGSTSWHINILLIDRLQLLEKVRTLFEEQQVTDTGQCLYQLKKHALPPYRTGHANIRSDLLSAISSYQDLYITKQDIAARQSHREIVSLHMLNHIMKYGLHHYPNWSDAITESDAEY